MKKTVITIFFFGIAFVLATTTAFAHVVVKPNTVGVAAFQTFTMGVPNEKDNPTTSIRLLIPEGLKYVTPNVKPGWKIDVKKQGDGENAKVTEITWSEGSIPPGQRDDFLFSTQVPSTETTLNWKAYQTYQNGETVEWIHDPKLSKGPDDDAAPPPYSQTMVINDLKGGMSTTDSHTMVNAQPASAKLPTMLSIAAIALSALAITLQFAKKK